MIQERIIEYLEWRGISKYRFYKDTGLSNGFLDKGGSIGTDKCERIISVYPDININWLITGHGSMLNSSTLPQEDDRDASRIPQAAISNIDLQEKEPKKSPIKQRILLFAADQGISKREFCELSGISRGTLENETGITEETLTKFLATYPDISLKWLIYGHGEIYDKKPTNKDEHVELRGKIYQTLVNTPLTGYVSEPVDQHNKSFKEIAANTFDKDAFIAYLDKKDQVIRELSEEVGRLKERIKVQ